MMTDDPYVFEKYEELYRLTKEGLDAEKQRSNRLDEKAARYLTFLTIVAGVGAFAGPSLIQTLRPIEGFWDWTAIGVSSFLLLAVFGAALLTLRVLAIQAWVVFPMEEESVIYFQQNRYLDILYSLARENIRAVSINRKLISDRKAHTLQYAYCFVVSALVLAFLTTIAMTFAVALKPA